RLRFAWRVDVTDEGSVGMASDRRIGAPDAKNRGVLLDAAEELMLEDGYAAVTSRRVAERAGLKPQLVHYYFRTMDEMFIEVFREQQVQAITTALGRYGYEVSDVPAVVWAIFATSVSQILVMERELGMSAGHAEMLAFCEDWLRRLEGDRMQAATSASV